MQPVLRLRSLGGHDDDDDDDYISSISILSSLQALSKTDEIRLIEGSLAFLISMKIDTKRHFKRLIMSRSDKNHWFVFHTFCVEHINCTLLNERGEQ